MARAPCACPSPNPPLNASFVIWPKDKPFHRIHAQAYGALQFNSSTLGNARFSPIRDPAGSIIPTIYGGTSFECAVMETIFRDVPYVGTPKTVDKARLAGQEYSVVRSNCDLKLVDLSAVGLRRLGVQRNELIDTEKTEYPNTRLWAEALFSQYLDIQGLQWISRQDDRGQAIVLFESRLPPSCLMQVGTSRSVHKDTALYTALLELAEMIDVEVV